MGYRVFISYSTQDQEPVMDLTNLLAELGVEVLVAALYPTPGLSMNWIRQRVVDVLSRFFPNLSQATIDWVHRVIEEELPDSPFFKDVSTSPIYS